MRKSFIEWFAWGCLLCSSTAWADPDDTFNLVVGAGVSHDDNLFRTPDDRKVSDEIKRTVLGFNFDKEYSLQRFKVDAIVTDYRYRSNTELNYTGQNLRGLWEWSLSPYLYGNLSTSRVVTLNSFIDYVATTPGRLRNVRTTDVSRFDVEWEPLGPLHLISAVSHYDQKNSELFTQDDNYSAKTGEFGVKYVTTARSSVSLIGRKTNGNYARQADPTTALDSGFSQSDSEVQVLWQPTVKSSVWGRVAYIDREYDNFSERNFSGYVGGLNYNWNITEKLSLLLNVRRDLNAFQESRNATSSYSSFYASNMYTISPSWEITEKTKLSLRLSREDRDYQGTVIGNDPLRQDVLKYRGVTLEWLPRSTINVNFSYLNQSRDSNDNNRDFKDNIYLMTVILNF
jgi:exopolysaccharide biosynthesis operon protein EpsL